MLLLLLLNKQICVIFWSLQEIQERVPADPFEAEILMMAEAVAKECESSSSDDEDNDEDSIEKETKVDEEPIIQQNDSSKCHRLWLVSIKQVMIVS